MLAQATRATCHRNCHSIVDIRSDVIFILKLIQKTDVFKRQPGRNSRNSGEFVDLFAKNFAIMNT